MHNYVIADSIVSLAALFGLIMLIAAIRGSDKNSLSRRFLFGLYVILILLAGRIMFWLTGLWLFDTITLIAGSLVPISTILITEGLLRRHAPFFVKILAAAITVTLVVLAFVPTSFVDPTRLHLLLIAQVFGFGTSGLLVLTRNRASLSSAENRMIDRIALSLFLIIPFIVTDFRFEQIDTPVRMGGIAILVLCWLTISLERAHLTNGDMLRAFFVLAIAAIFTGSAIALLNGLEFTGYVQAIVITLSATLVAVIYNDSIALRFDGRRDSLLRHMAEGEINSSAEFLKGLQNHPLVEGALILGKRELADFDNHILSQSFNKEPMRKVSDLEEETFITPAEAEQLSWLFEKYNSTHAILASKKPLTLVALNMPALSSSPGAETELKAVQRMAELISRTEN